MPEENAILTFKSLLDFFTALIGDPPPEFEGLVWVFMFFICIYCIDFVFLLLKSVFDIRGWFK